MRAAMFVVKLVAVLSLGYAIVAGLFTGVIYLQADSGSTPTALLMLGCIATVLLNIWPAIAAAAGSIVVFRVLAARLTTSERSQTA